MNATGGVLSARSPLRARDRAATAELGDPVRVSLAELLRLVGPAARLDLKSEQTYGLSGGGFLSPRRGRGMEYEESLPYAPGDDVRHLDWRVIARTGKPYTKHFREELERPVFIWLDLRASMMFATRGAYKAVRAARAAALSAWAAAHHGDRVGAILFAEATHNELRPRRGRAAVLRLLRMLVEHPAWRGAERSAADAFVKALARMARVTRPGSLLLLFSDFRGLDETAEALLLRLAAHNDVLLMNFYDALEQSLPPAGHYRMSDGRRLLALETGDARAERAHRDRFERRGERLARLARRCRMRLLTCRSDEDSILVLQHGMARR